tara:strand:- start:64856 stop:65014 length:159 start_codon:yes stop_codon:yes gene_type:complete
MILGCIFCGGILEWMFLSAIIGSISAFVKGRKANKCKDPECGCHLEEETVEE